MIHFTCCNQEYAGDLMELIRLFDSRLDSDLALDVSYSRSPGAFCVTVRSDKFENFAKSFVYPIKADGDLLRKREEKRFLKMAIYNSLSFLTGIRLPYGCLTGIRPTKLYAEISAAPDIYGKSARRVFVEDYDVSERKVELIERIVDVQKPLRNKSEADMDVFVFIPFCPTRCAYCSFVSLPLDKQKKLVDPYVECLSRELKQINDLISSKGINVRAVYIGGGTPTSIGVQNLDKILSHCPTAPEFTVEAGRPDTIDRDMIEMLLSHDVNRISVNPQTFNDATLELIGRKHRARDIYNAFALVKGKMTVNMDLIAMLPGEAFEDFKRSVDIACALAPENITVHTLYMKKGSRLKNEGFEGAGFELASKMVDYAYDKLSAAGYRPYYMYRQKYTSGNLENVGYSLPGNECLYNIDIMEEDTSIIAGGANAISKKWEADKNLITRCANYKEPLEYIKNIDLMLSRQSEFWK